MTKYASLQRYSIVLAILFVVAFYTNFDLYNDFTGLLYSVAPKYVMLGLGILSLPIVWRRLRYERVRFDAKLLMYVFVAASIFLVSLLVHFSDENLGLFRVQLSGLALLLLCYLVFLDSSTSLAARRTVLVCLIFAILISLLEVIYPGVVGFYPGRSAALYLNPDINTVALNTGLVLTIGLLPARIRLMLLIAVGAAILGTLSKTGMIIWAVVAIVFWLQGTLRAEWRRADVLVYIFVFLSFVLFFSYAYAVVPQFRFFADGQIRSFTKLVVGNVVDPEEYNKEILNMLPFHIESRGISEADVEEVSAILGAQDSSAERMWHLRHGLTLYWQNPVWGIGMERAWHLAVHNNYLLYGLAYGVIGWVLVPALALVIMLSGDRRVTFPMALVLLVGAMFSHNTMVDRTVLVPLALAATIKLEIPPQHRKLLSSLTTYRHGRSNEDLYSHGDTVHTGDAPKGERSR